MRLLRLLPRFRQAYASLDELARREQWGRADIETWQLENINAIWRHATQYVAYYRRLQEQERLPEQFRSLSEYSQLMPCLPKATVQVQPHELLSSQTVSGSWQRTGGSTGAPTGVFWPTAAHRASLRARYRCQAMWGIDFLERQAILWGHAASFTPGWPGRWARYSQPTVDLLRGRLRLSAYELGPRDLEQYLTRIRSYAPTTLYGYSAALLLLARRARSLGISCPSLKLSILSGEPAGESLKSEIEAGFAAPASIEYGSVECGVMANEGPDRKLRVREDVVFVETVAREDGYFDIVVTVLTNSAFPLLRYKVGDVTDAPLQKPLQGFAILTSVVGRQNDLLRSRSGRPIHPMGVKHTLEKYPNIQRFRAYQDASGQLRVLFESVDGNSRIDTHDAAQRLRELLEGYPVVIEQVATLPRTSAGKHRWVVSELSDS